MSDESSTLHVLLFAGLRQRAGRDRLEIPFPAGGDVAALLRAVGASCPAIADSLEHCRVAVDQQFAASGDPIPVGAEVALIPPVSGGHDGPPTAVGTHDGSHSRLTDQPLELGPVVAGVEHRNAGGVATFTGNVRERSRGKTVRFLEYEAYAPMAVRVMDEIAAAIEAEISGARVRIHHRVGHLEIGDSAVMIAASAPHRAEAFDACRAAIERLKRDVPIWKREVDTQGDEWIGTGP